MACAIRVGIGGWVYPPWRGSFYPVGLPQKQELAYAAGRVTSIEINATYYRTQTRHSFAKWRDATPPGFVFAMKGPRAATNRRRLAEAGPAIERFLASGVTELQDRLGPINWQFMPAHRFQADDFAAFLQLLPHSLDGCVLRHAVEVRHASFDDPAFVALARSHGVAIVMTDNPAYPRIEAATAPFAYARLQCASEAHEAGYAPAELDALADRARRWAAGRKGRDVFAYCINGFKPRAPAAAMALLQRL